MQNFFYKNHELSYNHSDSENVQSKNDCVHNVNVCESVNVVDTIVIADSESLMVEISVTLQQDKFCCDIIDR